MIITHTIIINRRLNLLNARETENINTIYIEEEEKTDTNPKIPVYFVPILVGVWAILYWLVYIQANALPAPLYIRDKVFYHFNFIK